MLLDKILSYGVGGIVMSGMLVSICVIFRRLNMLEKDNLRLTGYAVEQNQRLLRLEHTEYFVEQN